MDKDDGGVTVLADTSATEKDATNAKGYYIFDLAQAETNADKLLFSAKSSTSNIVVIGVPSVIYTLPATGILAPTTSGRTLDVSLGGEAGVDWANVGSPTTTLNLSGTSVKTATDVETDTQDIQGRLPAALVSGRVDASVGAMASGVVTATAIAADAIGASELAADAVTEIVTAILAATVETGVTVKQMLEAIGAAVAGNYDDATGTFKAVANSGTTRLTTVLSSNNRTNTPSL